MRCVTLAAPEPHHASLASDRQARADDPLLAELYISPATVKRHANNIYGKLGVHGRFKAVAKATGLGILKDG